MLFTLSSQGSITIFFKFFGLINLTSHKPHPQLLDSFNAGESREVSLLRVQVPLQHLQVFRQARSCPHGAHRQMEPRASPCVKT